MLQYERMASTLPGGREFVYCSRPYSLDEIQQALAQEYGRSGIPVAFRKDKVKSGLLSSDPCLVVYNPENLDYHIYVFVVRQANNSFMLSLYSAGTASAMHIGGGVTNMAHMSTKISGLLKTGKQKEIEEKEYITASSIANDDALIALGICSKSDFSYRN